MESEFNQAHWSVYYADHGTLAPAVTMDTKTDETLMGNMEQFMLYHVITKIVILFNMQDGSLSEVCLTRELNI